MHSTSGHRRHHARGFTLVEVLIISPMIVLLVAVIVGFMVGITSDALVARERSALVHDTQSGLDQIEQDVRLATEILPATDTLTAPQGSDGLSAPFVGGSDTLILRQYTTTRHPNDPARSLLHLRNQPNPCGGTQHRNEAASHLIIYFMRDDTLFRRTIVDIPSGTICNPTANGDTINPDTAAVWQRNSCESTDATGRCLTTDTIVVRNVSETAFSYYTSNQLDTPQSAPDSSTSSIRASITTSREIAGQQAEFQGAVRAMSIQ